MSRLSLPHFAVVGALVASSLLVQSCGGNRRENGAASAYQNKGCASCHGTDGEGRVGPGLVDLYGSTITVTDADGNEVEVYVDGDYLRESITDPNAYKVPGYRTVMPTVDLTDEQVDELVAYIESLSSVPPDISTPTSEPAG